MILSNLKTSFSVRWMRKMIWSHLSHLGQRSTAPTTSHRTTQQHIFKASPSARKTQWLFCLNVCFVLFYRGRGLKSSLLAFSIGSSLRPYDLWLQASVQSRRVAVNAACVNVRGLHPSRRRGIEHHSFLSYFPAAVIRE